MKSEPTSTLAAIDQPRLVLRDWCCPTCGSIVPIPERPPLGTKVKNPVHGRGVIFSYEACDETSCGVDFGKNGQWCMALRDLEILSHNDHE